MNSKTFLRILFVLKVVALEEAQSAAKTPNEKKSHSFPGAAFCLTGKQNQSKLTNQTSIFIF